MTPNPEKDPVVPAAAAELACPAPRQRGRLPQPSAAARPAQAPCAFAPDDPESGATRSVRRPRQGLAYPARIPEGLDDGPAQPSAPGRREPPATTRRMTPNPVRARRLGGRASCPGVPPQRRAISGERAAPPAAGRTDGAPPTGAR